jgi:hypothetical protein
LIVMTAEKIAAGILLPRQSDYRGDGAAQPSRLLSKEALMRGLAMTILAVGTLSAAAPASAQTYDPNYPVCLHVFGRGAIYYECRYTSLAQCSASASGRPAECEINPYFAVAAYPPLVATHHRRHHGPAY